MASSKAFLLALLVFFLLFRCTSSSRHFPWLRQRSPEAGDGCSCVNAIYSFGDSIADTGNLLREGVVNGSFEGISRLPYGETTFRYPTGRCSDGLLMIDFVAKELGLPFLNPYLDRNANFNSGVNFAVAGATALDQSFFTQGSTLPPFTNSSLGVQFGWFKTHLKNICSSDKDCAEKIKHALFFVGEIGGNDYNYAFFAQQTIQEVQEIVPLVVEKITNVARELLDMGATKLIIPGNFPIGCMPGYLTLANSSDPSAYDKNNCIAGLNAFALFHNAKILQAIQTLRISYPHAAILYADYFSSFMYLLNNAHDLGFNKATLSKACCGASGRYNFNGNKLCGSPGTSLCSNPSRYISWDGIHLTQEAYRLMVKEMIARFTYPLADLQKVRKC